MLYEVITKSDNISSPVKEGEYYFTGNPLKSKKNKVFNYGSIKQKIDIKQGVNYSLYLSGIMSSGKVWIDNELLSSYVITSYSIHYTKLYESR